MDVTGLRCEQSSRDAKDYRGIISGYPQYLECTVSNCRTDVDACKAQCIVDYGLQGCVGIMLWTDNKCWTYGNDSNGTYGNEILWYPRKSVASSVHGLVGDKTGAPSSLSAYPAWRSAAPPLHLHMPAASSCVGL